MFKQIAAITAMNLASIRGRIGASLVVVFGMTCVVAVFVSMMSMSAGFMRSVHNTGRSDRAMVMSQGSTFEFPSIIQRDAVPTIADAPGIARTAEGKPLLSNEAIGVLSVIKRTTGSTVFVQLRGIGPEAFKLRPNWKLIAGRMFQPAVHEVVVGKSAQAQFKGVEIGDKIAGPDGDWTVVGAFESDDDVHQSEILADADTLVSAYRRNTFNSVTVQLTGTDAFAAFKDALTTNPALSVDVVRETDYYENLSKQLNTLLAMIAYWVGGIMALGAIFGALNTMYAAVSTRTVEIATLRAVGFGAAPVVISVLVEALLLAVAGAAIGGALGWIGFNGNTQGFGGLVFKLSVSPAMLMASILAGAVIGLIGGLFPAIRAARMPVAQALAAR
jgi:putative ABC transport system permease protein